MTVPSSVGARRSPAGEPTGVKVTLPSTKTEESVLAGSEQTPTTPLDDRPELSDVGVEAWLEAAPSRPKGGRR